MKIEVDVWCKTHKKRSGWIDPPKNFDFRSCCYLSGMDVEKCDLIVQKDEPHLKLVKGIE